VETSQMTRKTKQAVENYSGFACHRVFKEVEDTFL
jgi:hypothetical protein